MATLTGMLSHYRFTGEGCVYRIREWRLVVVAHQAAVVTPAAPKRRSRPRRELVEEGEHPPTSGNTYYRSTDTGVPDELVVTFSANNIGDDVDDDALEGWCKLIKSSARREKHDAWGRNFRLRLLGEDVCTKTVHLVAQMKKEHDESVLVALP